MEEESHSGLRSSGMVRGAYTRLHTRRMIMKMMMHTAVTMATGIKVVPNLVTDDDLLFAV